jgi:hypothetical protein
MADEAKRLELAEQVVSTVLAELSDRGAIDKACVTWGASVHQEIRRVLAGKVADLLLPTNVADGEATVTQAHRETAVRLAVGGVGLSKEVGRWIADGVGSFVFSRTAEALATAESRGFAAGRASVTVPDGDEYASPSVWAELRGLYEIAKKAWAVRTCESPESPGELDEALDFYVNVALPAHMARIVKPVPYPAGRASVTAKDEGWVRCSERLPEPGIDVLVLDGRRRTCSVLHLLPDASRGWYPGGWDTAYTSHWMPLPPGPADTELKGAT